MKYTFFKKIKNSTKPYHILLLQSSITSWPEILQKRSMYIERTSDHLRGGFDLVEQPGQITRFVASLSTVLSWLLAGQRGTTTENSNIRVCAQPSVVFYTAHVKKIGSSMSRRWGKMSGIISIVLATCCGSTPNVSAPVPHLTITLRSNVIEMEGAPRIFRNLC